MDSTGPARHVVRNIVLAVLALLAMVVSAAVAEASVCSDLNAQLRSAGGGQSSSSRRAAAQVAQLRSQLGQASFQARQQGCTGFSLFRTRSPYCPSIMGQINQLQAALNAAEARVRQGGGQGSPGARARILQAMADNNCYARQEQPADRQASTRSSGGGAVECVRLCDGYSFPLGGSVRRSELEEAQQACQARCPGTEVRLYSPRGSSPAEMVSATGERYGDLPNAFAYLQRFVPDCGCNPAGGWPAEVVVVPENAEPVVPAPLARPVQTEDPETLANRAGRFVPRPVTLPEEDQQVAAVTGSADERIVRLVGPSYYYAGAASTVTGRPIPGSAGLAAESGSYASIEAPSDETTGSTAIRQNPADPAPPSQF